MSRDTYVTILKIFAFICALALLFLSAYFSVDGFNIKLPDKRWIGWILAISVFVIELVFNREGKNHNPTIIIAGIAAYSYGIWTNILGIMLMQGITDVFADFGNLPFPAILAMFLEIVPEPLLMWSLIGLNDDDLISKLAGRSVNRMPMRPAMMESDSPIRVADRHVGQFRPNSAPSTINGNNRTSEKPKFQWKYPK